MSPKLEESMAAAVASSAAADITPDTERPPATAALGMPPPSSPWGVVLPVGPITAEAATTSAETSCPGGRLR